MGRKTRLLFFFFALLHSIVFAQKINITVSGIVKDKFTNAPLPYVNVVLKTGKDSSFVTGTITNEEGRFLISDIASNIYFLEISYSGYETKLEQVLAGELNNIFDLGTIELVAESKSLSEVTVIARQEAVNSAMDKKTFTVSDNISQAGGSALEVMKNLPGITVTQEGKIQLRGSDKVILLIDSKQTALTGFGNQSSLENIPASAIDRIEIINNPSAKYDANGNAGIINIIYKKEKKEGFNGKAGIAAGLGALWIKKEKYDQIRLRPLHQEG